MARVVAHRLIDEVEIPHIAQTVRSRLRPEGYAKACEGFTCTVDLVEQADKALSLHLRQSLHHGAADDVDIADQRHVARVGQFEPVARPGQPDHEGRRLVNNSANRLRSSPAR